MQTPTPELFQAAPPVKFTERNLRNFWRRVDKNGPLPDQSIPHYRGLSQCWTWLGSLHPQKGYGQLGWNGRLIYVHRFSWILANGAIPDGMRILHRCDIRSCVNPDHLFVGTDEDNARDRESKSRGKQPCGDMNGKRRHPDKCARGERNGNAILTLEQIVQMRFRYRLGGISHQALADEYGIDKSQAGRIIRRQFWKHVT